MRRVSIFVARLRRGAPLLPMLLIAGMAVSCRPQAAWAAPDPAEETQRWTLTFLWDAKNLQGGGWSKFEGHVEFDAPEEGQAVAAKGPLVAMGSNYRGQGTLTIRGRVAHGVLTFVPGSMLTVTVEGGMTAPMEVFQDPSEVSIPLEEGAELAIPLDFRGAPGIGQLVWRIGGEGPSSCKLAITAPAEGQRVTFSDDKPGQLTLEFRAAMTPSQYEEAITWSLPELSSDTEVTLEPKDRRGPLLRVTLSGLPSELAGFGKKEFAAAVEREDCHARARRTVALFFPREASNNPGGQKPNWFYYWRQTPAARPRGQAIALDYGGRTVDLCSGPTATGIYNRAFGYKTVLVCDLSTLKPPFELRFPLLDRDTPQMFTGMRTVRNIDAFAVVVLHEFQHFLVDHNWYSKIPVDLQGKLDADGDGIPDAMEPELNFDPKKFQTYFANDPKLKDVGGDEEWLAFESMREHAPGSLDPFDWAHPGNQWP